MGMRRALSSELLMLICITGAICAQSAPPHSAEDNSPHVARMIDVDKDVKLEVLDWGGTGRPLILLAGLGFDAHVYDTFAPRLIPTYHVYAITRRGFGKSSAPKPDRENYSADRLGDDVLAVMGVLKISMPILVGHSLAGEELSSIGTRYPGSVAGLIYLDAAYAYAFYDTKAQTGDPSVDTAELRMELEQLVTPSSPREQKVRSQHLLDVSIPRVQRDLQEGIRQLQSVPDSAPGPPDTPQMRIIAAIQRGVEIYSGVKIPVLAIFADPHDFGPLNGTNPTQRAERVAEDLARTSAQADAFQTGNPTARVVRLPNADHFVFRSNEADVLRELNVFISTLP
jgi:non-heme chloroperoxidase